MRAGFGAFAVAAVLTGSGCSPAFWAGFNDGPSGSSYGASGYGYGSYGYSPGSYSHHDSGRRHHGEERRAETPRESPPSQPSDQQRRALEALRAAFPR